MRITTTNIIALDMRFEDENFGDILYRFKKFPRHVVMKHIGAALKRSLKDAGAIPTLKAVCRERLNLKGTIIDNKMAQKRDKLGRLKKKWNRRRRGEFFLKAISNYTSKPKFGKDSRPLVAKTGWKYGPESRKAIWLEFGTKTARPFEMAEETLRRVRPKFFLSIRGQLEHAVKMAAKDLGRAKDPAKRSKYHKPRYWKYL